MADIERSVEIEQIDYNVDINNVSYSIDILPQNTYTIELNEQGPQGLRGYTGNGIESYELTSTSGLIDTYTITFTDGETKTVNVTNGRSITSITGPVSADNIDTYTINYNDNTTSTFTVTNGIDGINPTVTVGTTTTGNPGTNASVVNSGTIQDVVLDFTIPRGDKGETGEDGTDGFSPIATVSKVGDTATISITDINGTTTATISDGVDGTNGQDGEAATISVGTVTTGLPTDPANVTNVGTTSNAIFDFTIPKGDKGDTGATGNGVLNTQYISTSGLVDTYHINYTNGSYDSFTVTNGANGTGSVADVWVNGVSVLDGDTAKIDLTNYVTTDTVQTVTARKTFMGEKAIYFKQTANSDKLGFTLYNSSNTELGAFEFRPNTISGGALLNVNVPYSSSNYVGFRYWGTAVNVIAPKVTTAGNYFIPTHITDGTNTVTASNTGTVNISTLLPDISTKQDTLVSGINIKTVNNQSILGGGNIDIQSGVSMTYNSLQEKLTWS